MDNLNDWKDVNEAMEPGTETDDPNASANSTARSLEMVAEQRQHQSFFEIKEITGKGRGLLARFDIAKGTRVINEAPLFIIESQEPTIDVERVAKDKVKVLSKAQQDEYLALHNHFPEQPVSGIFKTNALPCGPGSTTGGIYPTICLINHSCIPNTQHSWNDESKSENIHTVRKIATGEEITISYVDERTSSNRCTMLKKEFGFDCKCSLCSSAPAKLQASDTRRTEIEKLEKALDDRSLMINPAQSLTDCRTRVQLLEKEYQGAGAASLADVYHDAFEFAITHSDKARASVFARRTHRMLSICVRVDHPETKKLKRLMEDPTGHRHSGRWKSWESSKDAVPKNLDSGGFEKWLWREGEEYATAQRERGDDADCIMS